jgi:hypothetical protein
MPLELGTDRSRIGVMGNQETLCPLFVPESRE